jgi:predicted amidohydrolase
MKVAAYQAPLLAAGSMDTIDLMQERVEWCGELMSYGSSAIVDPNGNVVRQSRLQSTDVLVADVDTSPRARSDGNEAFE